MLLRKLLIITGLSGSGKSSVLDLLEDQGLYVVDNLPVVMVPQLLSLLADNIQARENGVAAIVDARSGKLLDHLPKIIQGLRDQGVDVALLFLEASEQILTQRYNFTRRRHPLGFMTSILDGIETERRRLAPLRALADQVIDTSSLTSTQLRNQILSMLGRNPTGLEVLISSFGFKYGCPQDSDFVFDVRFLANPYHNKALRDLNGTDEAVRSYIYRHSATVAFLQQCLELFETILPVYHASGKHYLQIAFGCTGGRHRSVFVAEWLAERLQRMNGVVCALRHRDIDRDLGGAL